MTNPNKITSICEPTVPYELATGKPKYGLTNDYMFRAVFQENELARKGLIASVLHMYPEVIESVDILNSIEIGDHIEDKDFILDLKVLLNNGHIINLEMQMTNQHNWQDRSLSYLCRTFDQLYKGEDYSVAKPATHIGFLNFTPFPKYPEFSATYKLLNVKNHIVYSDKFTLHMVDLTHIELATEEDKAWNINYWARLFTATTWEDVKMIAEKDIYMEAAAKEMYRFSEDQMIEERCRARDDFMKQERTRNKIMKELTEALEAKDKELETKDKRIEAQNKELETKDKRIEAQDKELELLKQQLAELQSTQTT